MFNIGDIVTHESWGKHYTFKIENKHPKEKNLFIGTLIYHSKKDITYRNSEYYIYPDRGWTIVKPRVKTHLPDFL